MPAHAPAGALAQSAGGGLALDALTGLLDRAGLLARLESACAAASTEHPVSVLFVDVDHFKLVNDSLGHDAGDAVLVEVGRRLTTCTRGEDGIARFGGDEFVVVVEDSAPAQAADLAARVVAALAVPVLVGGCEIALSASVGFAVSDAEADQPERLLRNADTALYEAKAAGRGRARAFDTEIHLRALRRLELESDIRRALREQEFALQYQPQIDLQSGNLVGVEALLRWRHPRLGMVPPADFVPIAEQTGLIVPLGRWVIQQACRQLGQWSEQGRAPGALTINLSPLQLADPGLVDDVRDALGASGVDPSAVCLELTESSLMQSSGPGVDMLARLRSLGVYLGVDDFGTGFSSLARLRDLPVEVVKIDRSFVDGLGREPGDSAVVASIMSLAFAMGLHAIAEGVEDALQAHALARLGCTTAQGWLYSPAVDASAIPALCHSQPWRQKAVARRAATRDRLGISQTHGRPGRRRFIDEFLDQIGVHMHTVDGRT